MGAWSLTDLYAIFKVSDSISSLIANRCHLTGSTQWTLGVVVTGIECRHNVYGLLTKNDTAKNKQNFILRRVNMDFSPSSFYYPQILIEVYLNVPVN